MFRAKDAFIAGLFACTAIALSGAQPFVAKSPQPRAGVQAAAGGAEGKKIFETQCAACHGLDAHGGERAPDIATNSKTQNRSDEELRRIVARGIPGTGMPPFAGLSEDDRKHVVAYLRQLQGRSSGEEKLPGDAHKGHELFFGKGHCAECHAIAGKGGFLAQDLTIFGTTRSPERVRDAIVRPENTGSRYTVRTREGQSVSGVLRNEDNFSIQLQTNDGAFHLFEKTKLQRFTRDGAVMPTNYGSTLSKSELDDLIAFLVTTARDAQSLAPQDKRVHDEGADDDE
jgi:cytochrome c oxidase cbb3-type subunit III